MAILSFLSSPKIVSAILGVAITSGAIWYGVNIIQENGRLEERLANAEEQLDTTRERLQQEREQFENTLSNYNDVMSDYLNRIVESDQRAESLRNTINTLSMENEELQQCFEMEAPDALLDDLFGERQ